MAAKKCTLIVRAFSRWPTSSANTKAALPVHFPFVCSRRSDCPRRSLGQRGAIVLVRAPALRNVTFDGSGTNLRSRRKARWICPISHRADMIPSVTSQAVSIGLVDVQSPHGRERCCQPNKFPRGCVFFDWQAHFLQKVGVAFVSAHVA
jgi:hypothetical protein